ncbi:hypothetical protein ADU59_21615 [Pararhizobium polonicum]|uniref:CoA-transferase n=1 Tax=Pararhizobium polonicum TaxID=1612624 RepID=A0A1C7NWU9_9HYPH|nr:CaiB/BaiF CoA-transferase family protein [Pararhizobium polonicum]OBZ93452.1 hypothetical protein ADU59_21615 [Pararhizobium polonicum]
MTNLSNLIVVEIAEGIAGPLAGVRLADLGATVIKVEPNEGDFMREASPAKVGSDMSAAFFELNRGKKSVQLGEKLEQATAAVDALLAKADVLILDRSQEEITALGLEDVTNRFPGLIVVDISPWGRKGPMADLQGSELTAQAMAGYTRYLGRRGLPARRLGSDAGSIGTGIFAVQAALSALLHRNDGGRGQRISVSILNSLLSMKSIHLAAQSDPDAYKGPRVGGPHEPVEQGWKTADKPIYFAFGGSVGATGRAGWEQFVEEMGMSELLSDSRFDKRGKASTGHGSEAIRLRPVYEKYFANKTSAELVASMHKHRANAAVYATAVEALEHEQTKALGIVVEVPDHGGQTKVRAFPGAFSDIVVELKGDAPALGADTGTVLAELGFTPEQQRALQTAGGIFGVAA